MQKQKVYIPTTDKEGFTHIISDPSKNEICGAREVEGYVIRTSFDNPPIPIRELDWSAWDDSTLDIGSIIGHGKTEQEAIRDFINQSNDEL